MTEKELSCKTNKELAKMLEQIVENTKIALIMIDADREIANEALDNAKLFKEVSRRLCIEPHITFEDAQFDM